MKLDGRNVEMTCTLVLTEREVRLLGRLAGFGGKHIADAISEKLTKEYSVAEWETLWAIMHVELEAADKRFRDTKAVFNGNMAAKPLGRK